MPLLGSSATRPRQLTMRKGRIRIIPILLTFMATGLAVLLGWAMWEAYWETPWTRDGTVRSYVVIMAPERSQGVSLSCQFPTISSCTREICCWGSTPQITGSRFSWLMRPSNRQGLWPRMRNESSTDGASWNDLAVTAEELQTFEANAVAAQAQYQQALASRDQAKVNLDRTEIRSPVNGWVTNLLSQLGDYATVGRNAISLLDGDSSLGRWLFRGNPTHLRA